MMRRAVNLERMSRQSRVRFGDLYASRGGAECMSTATGRPSQPSVIGMYGVPQIREPGDFGRWTSHTLLRYDTPSLSQPSARLQEYERARCLFLLAYYDSAVQRFRLLERQARKARRHKCLLNTNAQTSQRPPTQRARDGEGL